MVSSAAVPCTGADCALGPFSLKGRFPHLLAEVLLDGKLGMCL